VLGFFRNRLVVFIFVEALVGHVVVGRCVLHRTVHRSVTVVVTLIVVVTLVFFFLLLDTFILAWLILLDFIHESG